MTEPCHERIMLEICTTMNNATLQYNVAQLLKEAVGASRDFKAEGATLDLAEAQTGPVNGTVKLTRTNRSILVQAKLRVSAKFECSRCLKEVEQLLKINIEEEFFPTLDVVTGKAVALPEEPGVFTIDENHMLDMTEAVRQYLLLALPMKPLCRPDCAGICPDCGQDLNEGACGCRTNEIDPRWAKLAQLTSPRGKK